MEKKLFIYLKYVCFCGYVSGDVGVTTDGQVIFIETNCKECLSERFKKNK